MQACMYSLRLSGAAATYHYSNFVQEGLTALMIAVKNGRTDMAEILLSGNCDVDIQESVSYSYTIKYVNKIII